MKRSWKLAPCPDYQMELTESWLQDMAQDGWFLTKDGFFLGGAFFEQRPPRSMRYRLEASEKPRSLWDDNGGDPNTQAQELCEDLGWSYVCSRGQFYIYCTEDPTAAELNTDPEIQAMTIKELKKRQKGSAFSLSFWLCIYPLLGIGGYLFSAITLFPLWVVIAALLLIPVELSRKLQSLLYLRDLQKRLQQGKTANHSGDWRKNKNLYWLMSFINWFLLLTVVFYTAKLSLSRLSDEGVLPLEYWETPLPFATMADFGNGGFHYHDFGSWTNRIELRSTYLAPTIIEMNQNGEVETGEGSHISGGLDINYIECRFHWMAEPIAKEMLRFEKRDYHRDDFHLLPLPEMGVDYAVACTGLFPTVIIAHDGKVISAEFYQTGTTQLELADWAQIVADSLKS